MDIHFSYFFFYLRLSRAALCRPSYQGFRDNPEEAVKFTRTLFARQPRERLPWLLLRNRWLLAAEAELVDEILVVLIAFALDVIKQLAALRYEFEESAT